MPVTIAAVSGVLSAVASARTDDVMASSGGGRGALPGALTEGFQNAFLVGAGFAVLGAVVLLIRRSDSRAHVGTEAAAAPVA